jgi:integrase
VKFTRQRYQSGSLTKEKRKAGPAVWIFRWRENTPDGRVNRKVVVGTVEQLPTKTAARKAAEPLRTNAIADNPAVPMTVKQLVKHYTLNELLNKAYSTQRTVETTLKVWVTPTWGEHRLSDVRTVAVERWLHGLSLANATKAKVRNVMHGIFAHACRHDWLSNNPISLVRQSAKREKVPAVFEAEELRKLLAELPNPARVMVFLTAATGLRVSEALGLKWSDVDFGAGAVNLNRAVVHQHVGEMKTEASQKPVPIDGALATALIEWSNQTAYRQSEDWVFASPKMSGKQPYWPETMLRCFVQPIARGIGITKKIGWHTFRRTLATLLTAADETAKTTQELMRHANAGITMNLYAQALTPVKRAAHLKVVEMIRPVAAGGFVPLCSHAEEAESARA